jgi:hypothetical protein
MIRFQQTKGIEKLTSFLRTPMNHRGNHVSEEFDELQQVGDSDDLRQFVHRDAAFWGNGSTSVRGGDSIGRRCL